MTDATVSSERSDDLRWKASAEGISLITSAGCIKASAVDIVRIEFKGQTVLQGIQINIKPSEQLTDLKFSRFPAKLTLEMILPGTAMEKPFLRVIVMSGSTKYTIPALPEQDQLIVSGQWFPLVPSEIREISDLLEACGITDIKSLSLRQCLELLRSEAEFLTVVENSNDREHPSTLPGVVPTFSGTMDLLVKHGFTASLYPYQKTGVSWLRSVAKEELGCILADEMGLGKTVQIIALLTLFKIHWNMPALIVAPATLLENWRREFLKFSPNINVLVHSGSQRTGFPSSLRNYDVVITSYDIAVRDHGMLSMIEWGFIILDEAQAIKNPATRRAIALKSLNKKVAIAVTGTPVENRLRDLWSLMDFSCPGLLGTLEQFEVSNPDSEVAAKRIERIVSPLILRRRVDDVADDLPEKIIISQTVSMSESALTKYEELRQQIANEYGNSATLVSLIKLRQFCTHPYLLEEGPIDDPAKDSDKYVRLIEILEEIIERNQKAIIFTSFSVMSDLLVSDLSSRFGRPCIQIDGRTPVTDRQKLVDFFGEVNGSAFLILNPRAAGTGLNITEANHVIHYNLEWNPAVEDQATARAYRRGQRRPVTVHRLFYPDTVEEVIDDRIRRKRLLADAAVVGTEAAEADAADIARALTISPAAKGVNRK